MTASAAAANSEAALPLFAIRRRIRRWIATRTRRAPGPWPIRRQRVYIVPTRLGYGYGLLLLVMLLGAMNYSNSMAFALTFLLAGIGLLAMHHTHGNLVNLDVDALKVEPVHAGEAAQFRIALTNASKLARYALSACWEQQPLVAHVDVPVNGRGELVLPLAAARRGCLPAPRFSVVTEFPLGLFHAWTWIELDLQTLVYPRLAAPGLAPPAAGGGAGLELANRSGEDEFANLRPYRPGDSLRAVHWKSLPKLRLPMVKQFAEASSQELWLDWERLPPGWGVEGRLGQLARWVLDAEAAGQPYGLRLPSTVLAPARGAAHRHACLAALALFEV